MVELRIASYNCCSIRKRVDPIKEILSNVDILVCQETILLHEDSHVLNQFDCNFQVIFQPSQPPAGEGDGRPVGGLAVFYRKINSLAVNMTTNYLQLPDYQCVIGSDPVLLRQHIFTMR